MPARSPEHAEALAALTEAIERVARIEGLLEEGEVLITYAAILHYKSFELVEEEKSGYAGIYMGGNMPHHEAIGLFEVAKKQVQDLG